MRSGWTGFVVVLVVAVAGCADASAPAATPQSVPSAPPATVDADTGGIEGLALTDEAVPLPGVRIGLTPGEAVAQTDAEGRFSFSGLVPGPYTLAFERLGYESGGRKVDVVAGTVTYANLTLNPILLVEPYVEPLLFNGYIRIGNAVVDIFTSTLELPGCEKCIHKFKINETAQSVVFEVTFKPTLPGEVTSTLYTQTYGGGEVGGPIYINKDMPDRDKVQVDKKWKDAENIHQLLYCGRTSVCFEQRYTEYVSLFHHAMPPDEFSALPPP